MLLLVLNRIARRRGLTESDRDRNSKSDSDRNSESDRHRNSESDRNSDSELVNHAVFYH